MENMWHVVIIFAAMTAGAVAGTIVGILARHLARDNRRDKCSRTKSSPPTRRSGE